MMKVAFYDTHRFEKDVFSRINESFGHSLTYLDCRMTIDTVSMAKGHEVICGFVNDNLNESILIQLKEIGIQLVALRSAGFNHVDLKAAYRLKIPVVRVPEYSPFAVAEYAVALILSLNRKIHRAHARVRELNFSLEGLLGFDMYGKTVGVIGTGRIGRVMINILNGFGCRILAHDLFPDQKLVNEKLVQYVDLNKIYRESDIISLHVPFTLQNRHMIDAKAISLMKPNVLIINTGRGGLIHTEALIEALRNHRIGGAGLDVYEEEEGIFFHDFSSEGISDDLLARLLTFPNVVLTSHQAFLTQEALENIAFTTLSNISQFEKREDMANQVML